MEMNHKAKILLVDDEERFAESLQTILNHFGHNCIYAVNGKEALHHLDDNLFDVVLLDMELPDMSGCDIASYIQKTIPSTSAIMLTGLNSVERAVEAMQNGAYDYLSKPINHDQLLKTIGKALEHNILHKKLEESKNRFQVFAEATWEGIVIHQNGYFIEANSQFCEMFGYTEEELAGAGLFGKILAPDSMAFQEKLAGDSGVVELIGRKKDGTLFPLEAHAREMKYQERMANVCTVRDISARIKIEEEKLDLLAKLAKAQKLKALGLMAGSVAHDLNNILTGLVTYPDLLLHQMGESNTYYPAIKKIQDAGKRASAVVNDLILLARGRMPQAKVENLNDIILHHLQSIEHSERQANHPGVIVQTHLQSDLLNCYCSTQHINKILMNLIGNALEAVGEDGVIKIHTENCTFMAPISNEQQRLSPPGEYVKLTISDDGSGVKNKDLVFDPFYTTKVKGKSGTGLGLSIVWNTVQEHNGWIELHDNNPGAKFEIYLPATTDQMTREEGASISPLHGNGESVLLIDDEQNQNELMSNLLTSIGYHTHCVTSGEQGLHYLKENTVDIILLDMIMGEGLNGRETFEKIIEENPGQKTIVVSGYAENEEISAIKGLGVSYILEKPVTLIQVGLAIKKALNS